VYLTILKPLPLPTGGLLGSTYRPPAAGSASASAGGGLQTAALVFQETA
jgi:hypothetical protein